MASEVSIVLAVFNEADHIARALAGIETVAPDCPWELVVVDDGSTDETLNIALACTAGLPHVSVHALAANRGRPAACNAGARRAKGELLIFVDADDELTPGFFDSLVAANDGRSLLTGTVVPDNPMGFPETPTELPPPYRGFLSYARGCGMAVPRSVFEQVGGFSENYADGAGDVEFSWRCQLHGIALVHVPAARVVVRYRRSLRSFVTQRYRWAIADGLLLRDFAPHGLNRRGVRWIVRDVFRTLGRLPLVGNKHQRIRFAHEAAVWSGHLVGSVRHRRLAL